MLQTKKATSLFLIIAIFVIFRPVFSTGYFQGSIIFNLSSRQIFALGISYIFIFGIMLKMLKRPTISFTAINLSVFVFMIYLAQSVIWGSQLEQLSRLILPIVIFWAVRLEVNDKRKIKIIFMLTIIGFMFPVIGSSLLILTKHGFYEEVYWTKLFRYCGMYFAPHECAHEMFVFLTVTTIYLYLIKELFTNRKYFTYFIYLTFFCAIYNLYKTYVRTVYLGFATMEGFHVVGRRRYSLLVISALILIFLAFNSTRFHQIFRDVVGYGNIVGAFQAGGSIDELGSGRIGMWVNSIERFKAYPAATYFVGLGVGRIPQGDEKSFVGASHNDLLSLLLDLGLIGLGLYFWIIWNFFIDIVRSDLDRVLKYIYLGFLFGVLGMNFSSNSYISRFELAQYFFLIMGIFYAIRDIANKEGFNRQKMIA